MPSPYRFKVRITQRGSMLRVTIRRPRLLLFSRVVERFSSPDLETALSVAMDYLQTDMDALGFKTLGG